MPSLEVVNNVPSDFSASILKAGMEEEDITETESSDSPEHELCEDAPHIVNGEDWNHITKPCEHDVLLGRGGGTNNHSGNVLFRKLVNEHKMRYLACSKVEKPKVARQVVQLWREMEPTGRFLARKDESKRGPGSVKGNDNIWFEVGDKKAREKASQCLRERTPDVLPYIKHLREHQNMVTAQGVATVQFQMQQQEQQQSLPHHTHHQMMVPAHSMHSPMSPSHHLSNTATMPGFYGSPQHNFRRNSLPAVPGIPSPFNPSSRRGSYQPNGQYSPTGGMPPVMNGMMGMDHGIMGDMVDVDNMTEMEYEQQMMMIQQNMMQQAAAMQRIQMQRNMQQQQQQANMPHQHHQRWGVSGMESMSAHDPLLTDSNPSVVTSKRRNRNDSDDDDDDEKKIAPDRATSLMSLTPANPDNELSLEDYRQQLEEYINNSSSLNNNATSNNTAHGHNEAADDHNDDDLQDDWEKERDLANELKNKTSKKETGGRGVNRNVSGMSALSGKSGMSLVSGFSGFSDMMNMSKTSNDANHQSGSGVPNSRDLKMSMARSVCSNLSLMSDMTDLSQNIDNLSLYDD